MLSYPVVLIHGYLDIPAFTGIWRVVERILTNMGIEYLEIQVPPRGSVEERTRSAIKQIAAEYRGRTVHLFGHSMGGINSRDIASKSIDSDIGFKVKTVTTFGTPHRGVKAIDFAPAHDGDSDFSHNLRSAFGSDGGAFGNLSHKFMKKFNEKTPDNPSVRYFSWAGQTELPTPLLALTLPFVRVYGPADGVVNVSSAKWGTHLGTIRGLDHFSLLGRTAVEATIPHLKAAEHNRSASVVPINNNLLQAVHNKLEGEANNILGVPRGILGGLGLPF